MTDIFLIYHHFFFLTGTIVLVPYDRTVPQSIFTSIDFVRIYVCMVHTSVNFRYVNVTVHKDTVLNAGDVRLSVSHQQSDLELKIKKK